MTIDRHYDGFVRMEVAALAVDPSINSPMVILKSKECDLCLPIWLGVSEMSAIAVALKQVEVTRPLTHDVMSKVFELASIKVLKVSIVGLIDDTYFAEIEVKIGRKVKVIDTRPSDAIAIALRNSQAIHVCTNVLSKTKGIIEEIKSEEENLNPPEDSPSESRTEEVLEVEILQKNELSTESEVNVKYGTKALESFSEQEWFECFENMSPADFKYKM